MLIQLIIIQVITFCLLIFALRVLFYRQLRASLARLKTLHEENLAQEEELKQKTELLRKQKEEELSRAKQEAERIINDSREKASKLVSGMETEAKEQADKALNRAAQQAEQFERDFALRSQEEAIQISLKIFKIVFGENDMALLQHQLVAAFIDELEKLPDEKFTIREGLLKVSCPLALSPEEKNKLTHILSQKLKNPQANITEIINPDIISGIIIQVGSFVIDGSLRNKLSKAIAYIKT
jgi:F-type H+-transporting ATPase subunit b